MGRRTNPMRSPSPPRCGKLISGGEEGRREGSSYGRTRKGYVPVVVGPGDGDGERFLIPAQSIGHPSIVALLEMSAEEFGYDQEGVLRIPCDPVSFRDLIKHLPFKTS